MNGIVEEWVDKAERDYATAGRELSAAGLPNFDAVCFHCQQRIEKLVKSLLIQLGVTPPRTHDLAHLGRLLTGVQGQWRWPANELRFLSQASVGFRYPGETADEQQATQALNIATRVRASLLLLLGKGT